jgi:hypothetical protein
MSELPQRFYTDNEKLRGLYFVVVSKSTDNVGNIEVECVDNQRRKWDIVVGDNDYVFYPHSGMLYADVENIYPA